MINESKYWKEDILKIATRIKERKNQKRWNTNSYVNFEKDVFIAFYAIRKLIEAKKLTISVENILIPAFYHSSIGSSANRLNRHQIEKLFDLENEKPKKLELGFLCNQIIHSYIFSPYFNTNYILEGIFIASDYERNNQVFRIDIDEVVKCLIKVSLDHVEVSHQIFDQAKKDFVVMNFHNQKEANDYLKESSKNSTVGK